MLYYYYYYVLTCKTLELKEGVLCFFHICTYAGKINTVKNISKGLPVWCLHNLWCNTYSIQPEVNKCLVICITSYHSYGSGKHSVITCICMHYSDCVMSSLNCDLYKNRNKVQGRGTCEEAVWSHTPLFSLWGCFCPSVTLLSCIMAAAEAEHRAHVCLDISASVHVHKCTCGSFCECQWT